MTMHGVSIDLWHAGLLTPLDVVWWLAAWVGMRAERATSILRVAFVAAATALLVLAAVLISAGVLAAVLLALVFARWTGYAYAGVRVQRWRTAHGL